MDSLNLMNFDPWYLFLSLVFSLIGLAYFRYGRRQGDTPVVIIGVGLMIYPYFITNTLALIGVGALLMAGPFVYKRLGQGG
jgi:hypothetical protein